MPRARLIVLALLALLLTAAPAAGGPTTGLVISQVFGGGGNAGAPYTNDYVELLNRGSTAVSLSGWTIQYATAAGTSWSATALSGSVAPGGSYLVQLASGASGVALPAPDATGTTNLAATGGKVALVRDATALTCGASAGSCSAVASIEDLVGYGSASDYEGAAAAPAGSATAALIRAGDGCTDSGSNGADFAAGAPSPHNSASPARSCGTTPPPEPSGTSADAAVSVEIQQVLSISLEKATIDFGRTAAGVAPAAVGERVTVINNNAAGYTLSARRTAFAPSDLPLALQASAPAGGTLASPFAGGAFVPIPVAPAAAISVGSTAGVSPVDGDHWPTNVGFTSPFPNAAPGRYTATLTFTVIGK
jgi:hypothetical protein